MKFSVEYFHPKVLTEIENWPESILADYARLVELLMEFGPEIGMPHSRAIGGGIFELRPHGSDGIGRALYCFVRSRSVVILHAFIKKTQNTPEKDLKIARKRIKEINDG